MMLRTLAAAILTLITTTMARADAGLGHYSDDACLSGRLEQSISGPDSRYDAQTGRDTRNYAPDRMVDFLHMSVTIDIPDMNTPAFTATQVFDLRTLGTPVAAIHLNAEQLRISDVTLAEPGGTRITHDHDGSVLTITFDPPLNPGTAARLVTTYEVRDPVDGLFWTVESPAWPGRPAQIHTQGQPETNRYWFPCHDFPNERLTTEFIVTVPEDFTVISNGHMKGAPKYAPGRMTFHWVQDKPHVSYLVSLIVGKFDTVDVAPNGFRGSLPVYVPQGKGELVQKTYGNTAKMVELFERVFDEPYPWDKYSQAVVWNFGAGGMENTSATTMYDTAVLDDKAFADGDLDGLIAHELCHQWTGDLITCNTWEHIWLNEGWATYGSALWYEHRDGYQDGYLRQMHQTMRGLAKNDHLAPDSHDHQPAMVSNEYKHPWEVFRRKANPYPKGSSVLHMLRMKLGDEVFFKAVGEYFDRYKLKTAETDDFRRSLEEVSGLSLEQFFDQWCERAGTPRVRVTGRWDEASKQLTITAEQLQRIDADNPAYVFDLPIVVMTGEKTSRNFTMHIDERRHTHTMSFDDKTGGRPFYLAVDPDLHVLMDLELDVPEEWVLRAAGDMSSTPVRLDAIAALGSMNTPESKDRLTADLIRPNTWYEAQAAAESLGKLKATHELIKALSAGIDDARPRAKALAALANAEGKEDKARAAELLARHASDADESYACRSAALEALGKLADKDDESVMGIFRGALASESQHDQVRAAAIKGLRELDTREAMDAVIPFCAFGVYSRTRPDAINALAALAHHDKDRALDTIEGIMLDTEARTRRAAREALVKIGDERGLAMLDSFIARTRHPVERDDAERLRKELKKKLDGE
ncbi:MAG: hypothetical protein H6812_12570 [Phycisphaeraceae bacterium]|nr:hypothetical protein [Phycisphaerales bacterium]MCB9844070.1 hypothetical protein [Phycisphaeraceae bacterium]